MAPVKDKCSQEVPGRLCSDATRRLMLRAEAQRYCLLNGTKHVLSFTN